MNHSEVIDNTIAVIDNTIAEMQRLRARVAELEKELKETQFSETSWRELAEYWENLCKAIMPK